MKHLRTIDCLEAEETILGGTPAEAKALLDGGASPVTSHGRAARRRAPSRSRLIAMR